MSLFARQIFKAYAYATDGHTVFVDDANGQRHHQLRILCRNFFGFFYFKSEASEAVLRTFSVKLYGLAAKIQYDLLRAVVIQHGIYKAFKGQLVRHILGSAVKVYCHCCDVRNLCYRPVAVVGFLSLNGFLFIFFYAYVVNTAF